MQCIFIGILKKKATDPLKVFLNIHIEPIGLIMVDGRTNLPFIILPRDYNNSKNDFT